MPGASRREAQRRYPARHRKAESTRPEAISLLHYGIALDGRDVIRARATPSPDGGPQGYSAEPLPPNKITTERSREKGHIRPNRPDRYLGRRIAAQHAFQPRSRCRVALVVPAWFAVYMFVSTFAGSSYHSRWLDDLIRSADSRRANQMR